MKILMIEVEDLENAGCNNGNYPNYEITLDNGKKIKGMTCRCCRGCSETDRIDHLDVGMEFENEDAIFEALSE